MRYRARRTQLIGTQLGSLRSEAEYRAIFPKIHGFQSVRDCSVLLDLPTREASSLGQEHFQYATLGMSLTTWLITVSLLRDAFG